MIIKFCFYYIEILRKIVRQFIVVHEKIGFSFWKYIILSQNFKGKNILKYKKKLTLSFLKNLKSYNSNKFKIVTLYTNMLEILRFERNDFGVNEFCPNRATVYYVFDQLCVVYDKTLVLLTVRVVKID